MSLFKSRELWSTVCGKDEQYDKGCMVISDILSQGFDCIIVGSHTGFLRIFQPLPDFESGTNYSATDLLIETQLPNPILQVAVGKLVSGSQSLQVGVLHPCSFAVYSLVAVTGSAQHGDQYHLVLAYEHQLARSAFSFVIGPFGGAKGRDFICIQSLDGMLSFFEQETFAVSRNLPCFLLPSPFVYVPSSDSFVIHNANWMLECYRYEVLVDASRKLVAWWTLNLGEAVLDMQAVSPGPRVAILVLGERNLYCLREGGSVESVKRLQYTPCCLHSYLIEPDLRLMVLVVSDTDTLLVYDLTALCWSSQLPFQPVSIARVNFKSIQGLVALLSEEGHLVCCYLGTEPAVFVAPPVPNTALSYDELQHKLMSLQQQIDAVSETAGLQVNEGQELSITTHTLGQPAQAQDHCQLWLKLSSSTALSNIQVTLTVSPPLCIHPATHHLPSLCEETELSCLVTLLTSQTMPALSPEVYITAVYTSPGTNPRVLQLSSMVPLGLLVYPAPPARDAEHKITLALTQPTVPLSVLFPELVGEEWETAGCSDSVAALAHRSAPQFPATVVVSKSSTRYRVQGDNLAAMCLILTQLSGRLQAYYTTRHKSVVVSFPAATPPLAPLLDAVDKRVELRKNINSLRDKLGQQTAQYRAIQRRLLSKLREKTVMPLTGLDRLLVDTHQLIVVTSHSIERKLMELEEVSCELGCLVRLVLSLVRLCDTTNAKDWTDLAAAMSYVLHSSENQGWEEVCEAGVNYLLSTSLAKSVRDHQRTTVDALRDTQRFKKHISVAVDRVVAGSGHSDNIRDQPRGVSPIMESEENNSTSAHHIQKNSVDPSLKLQPSKKALSPYVEPTTPEATQGEIFEEDEIML